MNWICKKNLSSLSIRQSLSFVLYLTESEHLCVRLKQPVNPIKKKTSGDVIVFSCAFYKSLHYNRRAKCCYNKAFKNKC